jgi:hypothetical protein
MKRLRCPPGFPKYSQATRVANNGKGKEIAIKFTMKLLLMNMPARTCPPVWVWQMGQLKAAYVIMTGTNRAHLLALLSAATIA